MSLLISLLEVCALVLIAFGGYRIFTLVRDYEQEPELQANKQAHTYLDNSNHQESSSTLPLAEVEVATRTHNTEQENAITIEQSSLQSEPQKSLTDEMEPSALKREPSARTEPLAVEKSEPSAPDLTPERSVNPEVTKADQKEHDPHREERQRQLKRFREDLKRWQEQNGLQEN